MPAWFSNDIEYWNPEHPPPTTPIRSPSGTGSWVAIISFTLAIAAGVRLTGAPGVGAPVTTSEVGVTVALAMGKSPLNSYIFSICDQSGRRKQIRADLLDGSPNLADAVLRAAFTR